MSASSTAAAAGLALLFFLLGFGGGVGSGSGSGASGSSIELEDELVEEEDELLLGLEIWVCLRKSAEDASRSNLRGISTCTSSTTFCFFRRVSAITKKMTRPISNKRIATPTAIPAAEDFFMASFWEGTGSDTFRVVRLKPRASAASCRAVIVASTVFVDSEDEGHCVEQCK